MIWETNATASSSHSDQLASIGLELLKSADYKGAIETLSNAILANPDNARALVYRAKAHSSLKNLQAAIEDCTRAIKVQPTYAPAYAERGDAYYRANDKEKAVDDWDKALVLVESDVDLRLTRISALLELDRFAEALHDVNAVLSYEPSSAAAYNLRGQIFQKQKKFPQALDSFNEAIKLNETNSAYLSNRALLFIAMNSHKMAIPDLIKARNLFKKNARASNLLAICYLESNDLDKALDAAKEAVSLEDNLEFRTNLAIIHFARGSYQEAQTHFESTLGRGHMEDSMLAVRANCWFQLQLWDRCRQDCEEMIKRDRYNHHAWDLLGQCALRMNDVPAATRSFEKAAGINPANNLYKLHLSQALAKSERFQDAIIQLNGLVTLKPKDILFDVLIERARVLLALRRIKSAQADFEKAMKLKPDDFAAIKGYVQCLVEDTAYDSALQWANHACLKKPGSESAVLRANVYYAMKKYSEAQEELKPVLQNDPRDEDAWAILALIDIDTEKYESAFLNIERALSSGEPVRKKLLLPVRAFLHACLGRSEQSTSDLEAANDANCDLAEVLYYRARICAIKKDDSQAVAYFQRAQRAVETAGSERLRQKIADYLVTLEGTAPAPFDETAGTPRESAQEARRESPAKSSGTTERTSGEKSPVEPAEIPPPLPSANPHSSPDKPESENAFTDAELEYATPGVEQPLAFDADEEPQECVNSFKDAQDWLFSELCAAIAKTPDVAEVYVNRGDWFCLIEEYATALRDYETALLCHSKNLRALIGRGIALCGLKQYPEAIESLNEALNIDCNCLAAMSYRALAMDALGAKKQALQESATAEGRFSKQRLEANRWLSQAAFREAIDIFSNLVQIGNKNKLVLADVRAKRGFAYFALKKYPQAIYDLTFAIRLNAQDGDSFRWRGLSACHLKDPALHSAAVSDLQQSAHLSPTDLTTRICLAHVLAEQKHTTPLALTEINHALQLSPKSTRALSLRARIYRQLGDHRNALVDHANVLRNSSERPEYEHVSRALTYIAMEHFPESITDLKMALQQNAEYELPYSLMCTCYLRLRQYEKVLECADDFLRIKPSSAAAHYFRYLAYSKTGEPHAAMTSAEAALERRPSEAAYQLAVADMHMFGQNYTAASAVIEQALEQQKSGSILAYKAALLRQTERFEEAVRLADEALSLFPKEPLLWLEVGVSRAELGRFEMAINALTRSMELDSYKSYHSLARVHRGYAYGMSDLPEKARDDWSAVDREEIDPVSMQYRKAQLQEHSGELSHALDTMLKAQANISSKTAGYLKARIERDIKRLRSKTTNS